MVRSQIGNLIFDLFFDYNLCFKYSNRSCEPILDIYVPRAFQWYKEVLNLMSFDPYNCLLKIWESIGILIPEVRAHLRVWGFIPSHSQEYEMWLPGSFLAHNFASPCLGREPKARVVTKDDFCILTDIVIVDPTCIDMVQQASTTTSHVAMMIT